MILPEHEYVMPIILDSDCEYFPKLKEKLAGLKDDINCMGIDDSKKNRLFIFADNIIRSLNMYFEGDLIKSYQVVENLVNEVKEGERVVTDIRSSDAFRGGLDCAEEVQLFRARLNDHVEDYAAKNMLHIPFDHRELVETQRFSISGLPCIYFGNTSYCCWIEMGRPADFQFNVSPAVIDDSLRLFNLIVTEREINDSFEAGCDQEQLELALKMLMLNIATSFVVRDVNRKFKSEFVFSQMLMLACKNVGLDGIIYYSKRVSDELFAMVSGINVALFATYDGNDEKNISDVCNHLRIGRSFNYSMYKQLTVEQKFQRYKLNVDKNPWINAVGDSSRQFPYKETEFYNFDNYLFYNWHPEDDNWQENDAR